VLSWRVPWHVQGGMRVPYLTHVRHSSANSEVVSGTEGRVEVTITNINSFLLSSLVLVLWSSACASSLLTSLIEEKDLGMSYSRLNSRFFACYQLILRCVLKYCSSEKFVGTVLWCSNPSRRQ